jgi:hypothetical protein
MMDPQASVSARTKAQQSLLTMQGKVAPNEWSLHVTPATKNVDGSSTEGSALKINRATGEVQRVDGQGQSAAQPLANHVAWLKKNPEQAANFDEIYGKGAAKRALGS